MFTLWNAFSRTFSSMSFQERPLRELQARVSHQLRSCVLTKNKIPSGSVAPHVNGQPMKRVRANLISNFRIARHRWRAFLVSRKISSLLAKGYFLISHFLQLASNRYRTYKSSNLWIGEIKKNMKLSKSTIMTDFSSEYPDAWLMPENVKDLKALNKMKSNVPATKEDLTELGISYWKVGEDAFNSPIQNVPWNYRDDTESKCLAKTDRDFSYANIITLSPDHHFPEHSSEELQSLFQGQSQNFQEICYVLVGSGFLDVRCGSEGWVRIHLKKGDLITLPEELYHRFTTDDKTDKINGIRYFAGQPFWTPLVRIVLESRRISRGDPPSISARASTTVC